MRSSNFHAAVGFPFGTDWEISRHRYTTLFFELLQKLFSLQQYVTCSRQRAPTEMLVFVGVLVFGSSFFVTLGTVSLWSVLRVSFLRNHVAHKFAFVTPGVGMSATVHNSARCQLGRSSGVLPSTFFASEQKIRQNIRQQNQR